MSQNEINSIVTTSSGMFGGLGKAFSAHLVLAHITFQGALDVAV